MPAPLIDTERLLPNPLKDMTVEVFDVGGSPAQLLIADNFYRDPHYVRRLALSLDYLDSRGPTSQFPGLEASVGVSSSASHSALHALIDRRLRTPSGRDVFSSESWHHRDPLPFASVTSFAIVTRRGSELNYAQQRPHADKINSDEELGIGSVVYLNTPGQLSGGTAFYRHSPSGWIRKHAPGSEAYEARATEVGSQEPDDVYWSILGNVTPLQQQYITESYGPWELLSLAEMRFNRAVVYWSDLLHSAYVTEADFGEELEERRLTQNFFIDYFPGGQPSSPKAPLSSAWPESSAPQLADGVEVCERISTGGEKELFLIDGDTLALKLNSGWSTARLVRCLARGESLPLGDWAARFQVSAEALRKNLTLLRSKGLIISKPVQVELESSTNANKGPQIS